MTHIKFFTLSEKTINKLLKLGLPSAMQMFFEVAIFTAAIWLSGTLGKNAQAANQIALNLSSMTFMVAMGLSVAAMVRVGNQKGLKDFKALKRITESIFLVGFIFAVVFALFFIIWSSNLWLNMAMACDSINSRSRVSGQMLLTSARGRNTKLAMSWIRNASYSGSFR